jgi:hypothetical protein
LVGEVIEPQQQEQPTEEENRIYQAYVGNNKKKNFRVRSSEATIYLLMKATKPSITTIAL